MSSHIILATLKSVSKISYSSPSWWPVLPSIKTNWIATDKLVPWKHWHVLQCTVNQFSVSTTRLWMMSEDGPDIQEGPSLWEAVGGVGRVWASGNYIVQTSITIYKTMIIFALNIILIANLSQPCTDFLQTTLKH